MFKSVSYEGFDGRPDLRAEAERGTPILADEIQNFHDDVAVVWKPGSDSPASLILSLTLRLPSTVASNSGKITADDLCDEEALRSRYRKVWGGVVDRYLDQRRKAWDEMSRSPVEVS